MKNSHVHRKRHGRDCKSCDIFLSLLFEVVEKTVEILFPGTPPFFDSQCFPVKNVH